LNDIVSDDVLVNIENGLKMIDVPTLVFFGENDDVIDPMDAKEYFESIVNKKYLYFEIIKNAKHSPDIENFLETKEVIINFLNK
jgi:pimeloyl-ACP methyl ester carboxylesterase